MTNAEKYLKDGVDEKDFLCDYIDFKNDSKLEVDINSLGLFLQAQAKFTLTEDEKVILMNVDNGFVRIRREHGELYAYNKFTGNEYNVPFNHLFQFIKDGEEYEIKELLNDNS